MNRPSSIEDRLSAFLEEGPASGPDDLLTAAHARARSTRQRPAWRLALQGDPMETTWRARPLAVGRLAFALLTMLLVIAMAATALVVGSRLLARPMPDDGRLVVAPIPQGPEAVIAFSYREPGSANGDIFTIRADGTELRRITSDLVDEDDPVFSPDGTRIAYWGYTDQSLRVTDAKGTTVLAGGIGCFPIHYVTPVWSPDGRWIIYPVDREPSGECLDDTLDLFIIPADGSAPGRRMLSENVVAYSAYAAWAPDGRIAFQAWNGKEAQLMVATVTDTEAPFNLAAHEVSQPGYYGRYSWMMPQWSPDGSMIASMTFHPTMTEVADGIDGVVVAADGSRQWRTWTETRVDGAPMWSPDGSRLAVLVAPDIGEDTEAYGVFLVDPDGGNAQPVTVPPLAGSWTGPAFSPDGSRILGRATPSSGGGIPGDLEVVTVDGSVDPVGIPAPGLGTASWQPRAASLDWAPVATPLVTTIP